MTRLTRVTARLLCATSIVVAIRDWNWAVSTSPSVVATSVACASSSLVRTPSTAPGGLSASCGDATSAAVATDPGVLSASGATTNGPQASVVTKPKLPGTG